MPVSSRGRWVSSATEQVQNYARAAEDAMARLQEAEDRGEAAEAASAALQQEAEQLRLQVSPRSSQPPTPTSTLYSLLFLFRDEGGHHHHVLLLLLLYDLFLRSPPSSPHPLALYSSVQVQNYVAAAEESAAKLAEVELRAEAAEAAGGGAQELQEQLQNYAAAAEEAQAKLLEVEERASREAEEVRQQVRMEAGNRPLDPQLTGGTPLPSCAPSFSFLPSQGYSRCRGLTLYTLCFAPSGPKLRCSSRGVCSQAPGGRVPRRGRRNGFRRGRGAAAAGMCSRRLVLLMMLTAGSSPCSLVRHPSRNCLPGSTTAPELRCCRRGGPGKAA